MFSFKRLRRETRVLTNQQKLRRLIGALAVRSGWHEWERERERERERESTESMLLARLDHREYNDGFLKLQEIY